MHAFPLFMRLENRRVLVVGSGAAAEAKVRLLEAAGASITRQSSDNFAASDVVDMALVIGAAADSEADAVVSAAARAAGVPVNVVDRPELSDFIMPAIVDRGEIVVAISTNGASPVLAQRVRAAVDAALPHGIEKLARFARRFRSAVHARIADHDGRRAFWSGFFDGPIAKALLAGREREAACEVIRAINGNVRIDSGGVTLLSVDPLNADLLTLGELRTLQQADLVIFDTGIAPAIVDLARRDAEREVWRGQEIPAGRNVVRLLAHAADARATLGR